MTVSCQARNPDSETLQARTHPSWQREKGKSRSKYGIVKPPVGPFSRHIAQQLQLPIFRAKSANIQILNTPTSFYKKIREIIENAQTRIYLSSLYIGKDETELIDTLRQALQNRPYLKALILTDALRSTREGPFQVVGNTFNSSCASLLASLVRDFPHQVDVRLYRTPGLPRWLEKTLGKRFVEGVGLQHMKVYGGDDEVIISGANLSDDYFTNRQDRYIHIGENRLLCNYLHSLLLLTSRFSYKLDVPASPDSNLPYHSPYSLQWDGGRELLLAEDSDGDVNEQGCLSHQLQQLQEGSFAPSAGSEIQAFTERWCDHANAASSMRGKEHVTEEGEEEWDTRIVPLLQMGPLGITQETRSMPLLFQCIEEQETSRQANEPKSGRAGLTAAKAIVDFTSGYFSLHPLYKSLILKANSMLRTRIITAAPISNGFFGSKGISRHLPPAYTWLEKKFWAAVKAHRRSRLVEIREWEKEGWTYHAKGVWHTSSFHRNPTLTLIGSSNFGSRSALRDLECTLLIETAPTSSLSRSLSREIEALRQHATVPVNDELFERQDRRVHWGVKLATEVIKGRL